jgi:hypothetical protein
LPRNNTSPLRGALRLAGFCGVLWVCLEVLSGEAVIEAEVETLVLTRILFEQPLIRPKAITVRKNNFRMDSIFYK